MRHPNKNTISKFSKLKIKWVGIYMLWAIVILPALGYADFDRNNFLPTSTSTFWDPNPAQKAYYFYNAFAVETALIGQTKEIKVHEQLYDEEIVFDEKYNPSEKIGHEIMEQALVLCQISQEYRQKNELDKAIELLDQAYLLILGINTYVSEDLIQQKEDLRFMISKRIIEIYASREITINGSQNEIPIVINKRVQYEIDLYTKGNLRNHFIDSYRRSGKYRQMIVDRLKEEGLPEELSWLPLIESGFRVKALSKSRALGLWQFIPSTGYRFGLSRNRYIDERLDPEKSTQAAIGYLKELHSHFGDWATALAAYNCGENRVLRVIRNQKINYLDNFWDLYATLPQETARYVPKFLATLHIVKNLEKYGLDKIDIEPPLKFESLEVAKKIHLKSVAQITGIDRDELEELNPELRQYILPGGNYRLKIPRGKKQLLLDDHDQILRLNPARVSFLKHRVQTGETLSLIARRYRTSVSNIMLANDLRSANHIVTGKTLKIPQKKKSSQQNENAKLIVDNNQG